MPIRRGDSVEKIAAIVSSALIGRRIDAVLTGGSVVSIYSPPPGPERYEVFRQRLAK